MRMTLRHAQSLISIPLICLALSAHASTPTSRLTTITSTTTPSATNIPIRNYHVCGVDVFAYVDGSYNHLSRSRFYTSGITNRAYDLNQNGFTLQQALVQLSRQPDVGFGGLFNFMIGRDANKIASYGIQPWFDSQNGAGNIVEAFLQYSQPRYTFIVGKFSSLSGIESSFNPLDINFSRSVTGQFATPATHTGIRGTYHASKAIDFIAGLNDGWDNVRDWHRRKTIELAITYDITPRLSLTIDNYNGQERYINNVATGPIGVRNLFDIFATYRVTSRLNLQCNFDRDTQSKALLANGQFGNATWEGIIGYINYQLNDRWHSSLRGEVFTDPNGFATGVTQSIKELTLTLTYTVMQHLELRGEARHDFSNVSSYLNTNGMTTNNNQQSIALEVLYIL